VIAEPKRNIPTMIMLAIVSLIVCVLQFYAGRKIGNRLGDRISGAQGLGQKNTALGMWLALTYLNPIVSIAPAAYIIWQNIINSAQIYFKEKGANI
jgi:BASS family bile acid:Na+ symporter